MRFDDAYIWVTLTDGRVLGVPLVWYPRLLNANKEQRHKCMLIAAGAGLHWPDLDEDLSLSGMLRGVSAPPAPAPVIELSPSKFSARQAQMIRVLATAWVLEQLDLGVPGGFPLEEFNKYLPTIVQELADRAHLPKGMFGLAANEVQATAQEIWAQHQTHK